MIGLIVLQVLPLLVASPAFAGEASLSPAEQRIAWARKAVETSPNNHQAHNELAMALARRARETSDTAFHDRAEEALAESFRLAPGNFEARKIRSWILLGRHEFAQALEEARKLNREAPDDLMVYGLLVDACAELGNYREAEAAAQWMLDLRPGNIPGLTRVAYLRELFGDIDGAVELLDAAYRRTPPSETEDRAWILTHLAHLRLSAGKTDDAEKLLEQALALFPRYHYALANLAKVRAVQHRFPEAAELLRQRYREAPHPENLFALAEALKQAGHGKEAKAAFAEFEKKARGEMDGADNSNRELIFYYADHARRPSEALRIAREEIARRRDVHTLDAYAWALSANGRHDEARRQIEAALAVGILDAKMLYHAGIIALKSQDRRAAVRHLRRALEVNPLSEAGDDARRVLKRLERRTGNIEGGLSPVQLERYDSTGITGGAAVLARILPPLEKLAAGAALPELPLHLPQRLVEVDDQQEYGEDGAENAPPHEVPGTVGGKDAACHPRQHDNKKKRQICRFHEFGH